MAHLFAVLTFLFNYIPNVGPLLATVLPLPIIVLDPNLTPTEMFLAFALPTAIHAIVGNFVEPKVSILVSTRSSDFHRLHSFSIQF